MRLSQLNEIFDKPFRWERYPGTHVYKIISPHEEEGHEVVLHVKIDKSMAPSFEFLPSRKQVVKYVPAHEVSLMKVKGGPSHHMSKNGGYGTVGNSKNAFGVYAAIFEILKTFPDYTLFEFTGFDERQDHIYEKLIKHMAPRHGFHFKIVKEGYRITYMVSYSPIRSQVVTDQDRYDHSFAIAGVEPYDWEPAD